MAASAPVSRPSFSFRLATGFRGLEGDGLVTRHLLDMGVRDGLPGCLRSLFFRVSPLLRSSFIFCSRAAIFTSYLGWCCCDFR